MTSRRSRWNAIAWNGKSFLKPSAWEIASIGKHYLLLGTHRNPQMELTWNIGQKRLPRREDIHKIQTRIFKNHLTAADAWNPYTEWMNALTAYEVSGFFWKQSEAAGYGVILFCPACNSVTLIQFFENNEERSPFLDTTTHVLSSFKDHAENSDRLWAVYDIRLTLPQTFSIKTYQFYPGLIKLVFFSHGLQIAFYRWSPASVLLSSRKLIQFFDLLDIALDRAFLITETNDRIEWECVPPSKPWNRLLAMISGKPVHRRVLIRHDPMTNRILAITAESRQSMDSSLLDRIFSSYDISAD